MKKLKNQDLNQNNRQNQNEKPILPISLSSQKKQSQTNYNKTIQGLFAPYKIDWKNPPTRYNQLNAQNAVPLSQNHQSRSFFKNMKNQLTNIKNDVQKLIKKQPYMDQKTIKNNILNSNSIKKNQNFQPQQKNKKCSSFTYTTQIQLSDIKKKILESSNTKDKEKQPKSKKPNQILIQIDSKQQLKLTQLQNKMMSLQKENQQILKKLLLLENKFGTDGKSRRKSFKCLQNQTEQEAINEQIKRMTTSIHKLQQLPDNNEGQNSDRIMQILESKIQQCESIVQKNNQKLMTSQSMLTFSNKTQKLQQKIQLFERQLQRLQSIILDLENKNKVSEQEKQSILQQLKQERQKFHKTNSSFIQQKYAYESAMKQIRILEQTITNLQLDKNHKQQSHQSNDNQWSKQKQILNGQFQKCKLQLRNIQMSYQQMSKKFQQTKKQLQKYKVKQNYYAVQLAKQRQKNKNSSTNGQQKDIIIKQLRDTIEKTIHQKNDLLQKWDNQVNYYKKELQSIQLSQSSNHQKNTSYIKTIQQLQDKIQILEIQLQQKIKARQMICNQYQDHINKVQKQFQNLQSYKNGLENHFNQQKNQIKLLHQQLNKCQNQKAVLNAKQLGKQFQNKINQACQQIYSLKKKLNYAENQIHQYSIQNKSLQQALRLYQQRDKQEQQVRNKQVCKADGYDNMRKQIQQLTQQNQQLKEKYDLTVMKLQNQIDSLKEKTRSQTGNHNSNQANVNSLLKQQLEETGTLRIKLKQKQEQIYKLKSQIKDNNQKIHILNDKLSIAHLQKLSAQQSLKQSQNIYGSQVKECSLDKDLSTSSITIQNELQLIKKKQESTQKILQVKNRQLKMKDQFITNALIGKINKKESDDQIHYLIRELERITKKHFFQ